MRQSQNAGILAALKEGAKITPMGALRRFGCFRLSARIADIRKMGYKVKTRIVSRNRKNYAEYDGQKNLFSEATNDRPALTTTDA